MSTASAAEEDQYSDDEEENDDVSDDSVDPKDNLTGLLSVDFGTKLRKVLKSATYSGYTPENRDKLYKVLYEYQVSQFDSVLEASGFTKLNKQEGIIDWKGSCQPDISKDTENGGLICIATHDISVLNRRTPDKWIRLTKVSVKCRAALDLAGSVKGKDSLSEWKVTEHSKAERPRRPSNRSIDKIIAESRRF